MNNTKLNSLLILLVFSSGCALSLDNSKKIQEEEINKLKQVGVGCFLFADDHKGMLPTKTKQLKTYMGNEFDFSYVKLITKNIKCRNILQPSITILAVSTNPQQGAMQAVLFTDGHCELKAKKDTVNKLVYQTENSSAFFSR